MTRIPAFSFVFVASVCSALAESGPGWVSYPAMQGPGKGKHVVLLAGDEEYRSEEALPMLAKILSGRHGFKTTVLFSIDADGAIEPKAGESLGHPESLDSADALILSLRFRHWSDDTMKKFEAAVNRGVPIFAMRTSTHSFNFPPESPWTAWSFSNKGGFGKKVLGETWLSHWGDHGKQATRGVIEPGAEKNPLLNGVADIFGTTDVYEAKPPADATILLRGIVLESMEKDAKPFEGEKKGQKINDPAMPIVWSREVKNDSGTTNKIVTTTMGAATDYENEGLRRLAVNSVYWGLGLPVPKKADVTLVGEFAPTKFGFGGNKKGVKAEDFDLKK
jgi:hypothetical protein